MAPKTQIVTEEPPAKVAKTGFEEAEIDAAEDKRPVLEESVDMVPEDTTLNVVPTSAGKVLMAISDGGLQFLVAASRANVGVKSGRYMFEVRVLEVLLPAVPGGRTSPLPTRQMCRIGFSKQHSSLFLGETEDSVCFDSDGCFISNKQKGQVAERFVRDNVLGVLLNLDPASPNANTVSLFKDGRRVCKPQPLPEPLLGHALFPHVSFRNASLQVHFGPGLLAPVPFRCRTIQEAAADDVVVGPSTFSQEGSFEILFPVALPDEGTFDWLDDFLQNHPGYTELSDRKIVEWAVGSGLGKPRTTSLKNCNDKPDVTFGIQVIDELTPRKVLYSIAPLVPRNYVIMEVKANLLKPERQELVRRFDFRHFRRVAAVVVGEPPESFKAKVRSAVLAEKQEKLDAEWNAQEVLRQQQKALREKQKAMEEAQKRMAEAAASAAASATAAAQAAEAPTEAKEEGKDEEMKEVKEEGAKEEGVKEEIKEEPEPEQQPPVAELDEEEQKLWFLPRPVTDMVPTVFNSTFMDFSLPTDEEDFAEIRYEWATELVSKEYMRSWMQAKKITTRVEDINCSETFTNRVFEWQRLQNEWQVKQKDFKSDPVKQQAAEVRADKEKRYEEKQEKQQPEAEAAEDELDGFVPLDIYSVKDVADIGEGEPLFANFSLEDWALLNLRFELTILMQGFRQDVADPERPGIHESHLGFYYNKYFRKPLNIKFFGVSTAVELCALAKDVVTIQENGVLAPSLSEEQLANLDMLVRLTEAARRERHRRIEAGDESSRLKFTVQQGQSPWPKATPKPWSSWSPAQPVAARPGFQPRPGTGTGARPIRAQGGFGFSGWGGFPGAFQGSW